MGAPLGIPRRRPRPYAISARAVVEAGSARRGNLPPPGPETAVIPVRGVLEQRGSDWECGETCGYDTIEADILGALSDAGVGQGVLDVDSPGGDDPGMEQAILRIRAGVVALGKPLLGYVNEFAASAAVALMVGVCDAIYLPPSGRMGSIGELVVFGSEARRLAKEGVDIYVGRQPSGKAKPHPAEPLDEVGKERIDRMAAEAATRFFALVERCRGIPEATLRAWNGDTFTGAAAVETGLADGVGSLDEVIALAETWPRKKAA